MAPRVVDKQQKKQAILMAAATVFAQNGYHASRMQQIASAAGIGKGTVYEYYKSKDELLIGLYELVFLGFDKQIHAPDLDRLPAREQILASLEKLVADLDEFIGLLPVFLETFINQDLRQRLQLDTYLKTWLDHFTKFFMTLMERGQQEGSIRTDIHPRALSRVIISMLDGFGLHYYLFQPDARLLQAQQKELLGMIADRLRPPGARQERSGPGVVRDRRNQ
ncbi:MAG: TetR/AcrR family transcriptional regulator [Leptospiraceae bacterium]|nr:TetR/AcrR family transcriptional regulator [Leptospiraceae bacterium]